MQIIDAHQHFWDLDHNYLPWLMDDPPIKFRYGDYSALKRNYWPADYRDDSADFDVVGTVFVETEWDPRDPTGEVGWVESLKAREGLPTVMVAQAWLDRADAPEVLEFHGRSPIVRGIRHKPRAASRPDVVEPGAPGSMGDPAFRRGFAMLGPNGLSYDLQTPWWHLGEARALADEFPDTQIILNHTGLPSDRSPEGLAGWRAAMRDACRRSKRGTQDFRTWPGRPTVVGKRQSLRGARRYRHLRARARDVRQQLSGRQPGRQLQDDLFGLRRHYLDLLGSDARRYVSPKRCASLPISR